MAKVCTGCGTQVDDAATSCPNCGAVFTPIVEQPVVTEQVVTEQVVTEQVVQQPIAPAPAPTAPVVEAPKKSRKIWIIAAIILGLLMLCGLATCGFALWGASQADDLDTDTAVIEDTDYITDTDTVTETDTDYNPADDLMAADVWVYQAGSTTEMLFLYVDDTFEQITYHADTGSYDFFAGDFALAGTTLSMTNVRFNGEPVDDFDMTFERGNGDVATVDGTYEFRLIDVNDMFNYLPREIFQ